MALVYGILYLVLGVSIYLSSRILTVFTIGLGLLAVGYWVMHSQLSIEERKELFGLRLMLSLMLMSIFLLARSGLVLFNSIPQEKVGTLSNEIILMLLGLAILVGGISISRSSLRSRRVHKRC